MFADLDRVERGHHIDEAVRALSVHNLDLITDRKTRSLRRTIFSEGRDEPRTRRDLDASSPDLSRSWLRSHEVRALDALEINPVKRRLVGRRRLVHLTTPRDGATKQVGGAIDPERCQTR